MLYNRKVKQVEAFQWLNQPRSEWPEWLLNPNVKIFISKIKNNDIYISYKELYLYNINSVIASNKDYAVTSMTDYIVRENIIINVQTKFAFESMYEPVVK